MEKLIELLKSDFEKARAILTASAKKDIEDYVEEFKGSRTVRPTQVGNKPPKTVGKQKKMVRTAKIPMPFQKKIVRYATAFLFGSPVKLSTSENEEGLKLVKDVWKENRLNDTFKKFCNAVKSQTEAALFFFPVKNPLTGEVKLKIRLKDSSNGTYYPYFDRYGDLQAFTWDFETVNEEGKKIPQSWVFTSEFTYKYSKGSEGWALSEATEGQSNPEVNLFKKIPVVYHSQEVPEWFDVKELIDAHEMRFSNFVDTNDYFASPMVILEGEVKSLPGKEDSGKAIRITTKYVDGKKVQGGDARYLTWEHAPEAIKLEQELSDNAIHSLTDTPDLSFNNVKGVGQVSGIALQLMFMGAIIKAKESEGDYSVAISRTLSLIKSGIAFMQVGDRSKMEELPIDIEFTSILPNNIAEVIQTLSEASGGKAIISQETAVGLNPLVSDTQVELDRIKTEKNSESVLDLGDTFN